MKQPYLIWVHIFLIGAVGFGLIGTALNLYTAFLSGEQTPFFLTLRIVSGIIYVLTGLYMIIAFYARRPNAMAVASTFLAMIALNVFSALLLFCFSKNMNLMVQVINGLVWLFFWGALVLFSDHLKVCFPKETRRWFLTERILLILYIITFSTYTGGAYTAVRNPLNNRFYTMDKRIQLAINELKKSTPDYTHGVAYGPFSVEQDTLCCQAHYTTLLRNNIRSSMVPVYCAVERQRTLWHYAHPTYTGQIRAYDFFTINGFYLKTVLSDKNKNEMGTFTVTPEEYAAAYAAGKRFRCDTTVWSTAIQSDNDRLPYHMMFLGSIDKLSMENDHLSYNVAIPETAPGWDYFYSREKVEADLKKALWQLDGPSIILADLDGKGLLFRLCKPSGAEYMHIDITHEHIHALHHMFED